MAGSRGRKRALVLVPLLAALGGLVAAGEILARPDMRGAREVRFTVHSRLVGRDLEEVAAVPAGDAAGRPLLVFLHGRGGRPGDFFSHEFYAALARLGTRAPIVVQLDGGSHSYWHDRRGGRWGGYVLREAIPAAVRMLGADRHRVAIGGISMGGYGAFDLARHARRGRFCAVGGHSPAFWLSAGATAPGAFDDAADFARHDLYAYVRSHRRPFGSTPLWIDHGDRDPFSAADTQVVRALRATGAKVSSRVWPGAHETAYWRAHTPRYLRFYAGALARCG